MNRSGEHFLARACFARDEDRNIGRCDPARDVEDVLHRFCLKDRAALTLDWIGRPERRAITFFLASVSSAQCCATETKDFA